MFNPRAVDLCTAQDSFLSIGRDAPTVIRDRSGRERPDMARRTLVASLGVAATLFASPANASILLNGSFESPTVGDFFASYGSGSTAITGWTVDLGTPLSGGGGQAVHLINGNFAPGGPSPAADGKQFLDVAGFGAIGSIYQTFNTIAGSKYLVTFSISHNPYRGGLSTAGAATIFGPGFGSGNYNEIARPRALLHGSGSASDLDWQPYSFVFTATGADATLAFVDFTDGRTVSGLLVDAVSVSAVPEPAAWVMMILGFGLIGGAMRQRQARWTKAARLTPLACAPFVNGQLVRRAQ